MMTLVVVIFLVVLIALIVLCANGRENLARAIISFIITTIIVIPTIAYEKYIALIFAAPILRIGIYYLVAGEDINL